MISDHELRTILSEAKCELQWAKEHDDDEYGMSVRPEFVIAMASELIALRKVAEAAAEIKLSLCGSAASHWIHEKDKALENWRKGE